MKTCGDCKQTLPLENFALRKDRGCHQSCCRACQRIRWKKWNDTSRGVAKPVDTSYVPLVDFLPMPPPDEFRALVYPVGYRVAA